MQVVAATANPHKLDEMRAVFGDAIELLSRPADVAEVIEDAATFVGNARLKSQAICAATGRAALADDSGLEVDVLGGEPGVESAYYGGGDHDQPANRARLLRELAALDSDDRSARFRTVMVLTWPNGLELVVEGSCEGTIADAERGTNGFGYDSLFVPADGDGRTFGEMSDDEKNAMSHRSRACVALLDVLDVSGAQRVTSASRSIAASADAVFGLITDPTRQPDFDGNDNLAEGVSTAKVSAVGDMFETRLTFGVTRENHVVEFEPGRLVAWMPAEPGKAPAGQLWRWEVEPVDDRTCQVTHTYDWTELHDPSRYNRAKSTSEAWLMSSIDRLADMAEATGG